MLYGFLSIIDQFGGVLRERGREYRRSRQGQRLEQDLGGVFNGFGSREKNTLDVVLSSLESVIEKVRELDEKLNEPNGAAGDGARSRRTEAEDNGKHA